MQADKTYRTTYGSAYGYNERFGLRDKHRAQGVPAQMHPPVHGSMYSSASFTPTYEYLSKNELKPYVDPAAPELVPKQCFPYQENGVHTGKLVSTAGEGVMPKWAAANKWRYDTRDLCGQPITGGQGYKRISYDTYHSAYTNGQPPTQPKLGYNETMYQQRLPSRDSPQLAATQAQQGQPQAVPL